MTAAIVQNNIITNVINVLPENLSEFPNAVTIEPHGLSIGDYTRDGKWYRVIEGVEAELPLPLTQSLTEE